MKILVTGASGLLGTEVVNKFEVEGHIVLKACSTPRNGFIDADLNLNEGIQKLNSLDWDAIVHCAAVKDPDICEIDKDRVHRLNVWAPVQLAEEAYLRKAKFVFISSDYVFDGKNSPYLESNSPNPINYYGKMKSLAEQKILTISEKFSILRIPILYGTSVGISKSSLLTSSIKTLDSNEIVTVDDSIVRYPTFTGDVAETISLLLNKSSSGVYHITGHDKTSKYQIIKIIADCLNINSDNVLKSNILPKSKAIRPYDCNLCMNRIQELGKIEQLPFKQRVKALLNKFYLKG